MDKSRDGRNMVFATCIRFDQTYALAIAAARSGRFDKLWIGIFLGIIILPGRFGLFDEKSPIVLSGPVPIMRAMASLCSPIAPSSTTSLLLAVSRLARADAAPSKVSIPVSCLSRLTSIAC